MSWKKIFFAPLFLITFAVFNYFLNLNLRSGIDSLFAISLGSLFTLLILISFAILSSVLFIVFCVLAQNIKVIVPVILISGLAPALFLIYPVNFIVAILDAIIFIVFFFLIENVIKTYTDFKPTKLFTPLIKRLSFTLIIISSFAYYLSVDAEIKDKGFEIPDSLIETSLKFVPLESDFNPVKVKGAKFAQINLTQDQIELLKNPPLPSTSPLDIKPLIKSQLDNMLKPYLGFIPILLTALYFFSLTFISSVLSILVSPLVFLIFLILEKTEFITFTTEQRTVKKLVV